MDFGFTGAQRELFERMASLGERAEASDGPDRLRVLAEGGALGLSIPREHGGAGLDLVTTAGAYEALGGTLRDGGVLLAAGAHLFGVAMMLVKLGTPEQKARWLPGLASGEIIATVCATEEGAGSDVAAVQSLAEPSGDGFTLTGDKRYVTAAACAGLFFVVARSSLDARGLTALLVPSASNGVSVGAPLATMGLRNAGLAPVSFASTRVEAGSVVGRPGAGLAAFQVAMTYERALILAFRLGAMAAELRRSVAFVRRRKLGEQPIAKHQAVAHRVARMKLRLETARLLTYRAAWALDRGERAQAEAALAKWHVADCATASAFDALKLRGGTGYLEESGLMQDLDDAVGGGIHSGTDDVLAGIVAAWMGL
ncbi:MAG: acyl-CoA dehydrogenase family protein [Polyangiaceae bacterium]